MQRVGAGRDGTPSAGHAVVEVHKLLSEALLVRGDLLGPGGARGVGLAVLGDENRGHAAQERRRKIKRDAALG